MDIERLEQKVKKIYIYKDVGVYELLYKHSLCILQQDDLHHGHL